MKYRVILLSVCLVGVLVLPAAAALSAGQDANSAPIAENLELTTYKNVAVTGQCSAVDPEGDLVIFQMVDKPARGQVELSEDGSFCYTPFENKKGRDSFTYVAVDANGNVSSEATVKVTIQKQTTKVSYSDMADSPYHYAALHLAERGVFTGSNFGGTYCFSPDQPVTRGEFLTMAMTAAGVEALEGVTATGFYDDDSIPSWTKGYVSAALMDGAVQGSANDAGQVVFRAQDGITTAEAAVMIDRLLAMGETASQDSLEATQAPAWASQAAANMQAVDVVTLDAQFSDSLTRGEAADMLSAMLDVLDSRESKGLFG